MRWFNQEKLANGRHLDRMLRAGFRLSSLFSSKSLPEPRPVRSIVVFEPYYLGDLIMATPALRALRKRFPGAVIDLVAPRPAKDLEGHFPWIDRIVPFRCPWTSERVSLPSMIGDTLRLLRDLRGKRYDMAIDLRGDMRNIMLAYLSGAKRRVAFDITGGEYLLTDPVPYDDRFLKHQLEGNLEVARFLGCDTSENLPELALDPRAEASVAAVLEGRPGPTIGIHPAASKRNKSWETGKWGRLACLMIERLSATVIVFHGPSREEADLAADIRALSRSGDRCVLYGGTVSQLISMIGRLDVLVALDSFASHVAAAVGTRFVTIFGPGQPSLTRPYRFGGDIVLVEDVPCRPCGATCRFGEDNRCMKEISVEDVWSRVARNVPRARETRVLNRLTSKEAQT